MAGGVIVDNHEFREYAVALSDAVNIVEREVEKVVARGANNIKRQMRAEAHTSRFFGVIAPAITYDIRKSGAFGGGFVEAEIGPVKGKPGSLANIAYFGTSRGGGTVPDPSVALEAEAPKFEAALLAAMERAVR